MTGPFSPDSVESVFLTFPRGVELFLLVLHRGIAASELCGRQDSLASPSFSLMFDTPSVY